MLAKIQRKGGTSTIWGIILSLIAASFMFPLIQYIQVKQEFHGTVTIIQSALKEATTKITVQNYDDLKTGVITVREVQGTKTYNIASMIMENIGATEIADDQYRLTESGYTVQILEVSAKHNKHINLEMKYKITKDKAILGLMDIDATKRAYGILQTKCPHKDMVVQDADLLYSGNKICAACGEVVETGKFIVPEGGQYTQVISYKTENGMIYPNQTKVLAAGEEVDSLKACDRLEYNDYLYMYQSVEKRVANNSITKECVKEENITGNGWNVRYTQSSVSQPPPIADCIGQQPVTTMYETFAGIYTQELPEMPDTILTMYSSFESTPITTIERLPAFVQSLDGAFAGCTRLVDCSNLLIPDTVTSMNATFNGCSSLQYAPNLPPRVQYINDIFYECLNLKKSPYVPEGVISMTAAFYGCANISGLNIPLTAENCQDVAFDCKNISVYYAGTDFSKISEQSPWDSKTTATVYEGYDGHHVLGG